MSVPMGDKMEKPPLKGWVEVMDGSLKKEREEQGLNQISSTFCETTTAHGLNHVAHTSWTPLKYFWVLVFVGAVAANLYHLSTQIIIYRSYPTRQVVSVRPLKLEDSFPDVTVCNLQPMSPAKYKKNKENNSSRLHQFINQTIPIIVKEAAARGMRIDKYFLESPASLFANLNEMELDALLLKREEFLIDCVFGHKPCEFDDIVVHRNPDFIKCYTYKGRMIKKFDNEMRPGPQGGLTLLLYLDVGNKKMPQMPYDRCTKVANAAGARIFVHPPGTEPQMLNYGVDISPGHSSSLGVSMTQLKLLKDPYGRCTDDKYIPGTPLVTSCMACCAYCCQKFVIDSCGCVDLMSMSPEYLLTKYPSCMTYNNTEPNQVLDHLACAKQSREKYNENPNLGECECLPPCTDFEYETTISQSLWPAPANYWDFFETYVNISKNVGKHFRPLLQLERILENRKSDAKPSTSIVEDFQNYVYLNYARVNVYLKNRSTNVREQQVAYTTSDLFSDIGGTLGLWAGISVLTLIEFIFFGNKLAVSMMSRKNKTEQETPHNGKAQQVCY